MPFYWIDLESASLTKRSAAGRQNSKLTYVPKEKTSLEATLRQLQEAGVDGSEALNLAFLNLLKLVHKYGTEKNRIRVKQATQHVNSIISKAEGVGE